VAVSRVIFWFIFTTLNMALASFAPSWVESDDPNNPEGEILSWSDQKSDWIPTTTYLSPDDVIASGFLPSKHKSTLPPEIRNLIFPKKYPKSKSLGERNELEYASFFRSELDSWRLLLKRNSQIRCWFEIVSMYYF
jgi:hypothetical protein